MVTTKKFDTTDLESLKGVMLQGQRSSPKHLEKSVLLISFSPVKIVSIFLA